MRYTIVAMSVGVLLCCGEVSVQGAGQQGRQGGQKAAQGNRANAVGMNANAAGANGNAVAPAVQQLLQQFDANRNDVLDGDELARVAAAFQQLVMVRMGQAGGMQAVGMQAGGGQGIANQACLQAGGQGQGGNQMRFQHALQNGQGGGGGGWGGGGNGGGRR